MKNWIKGAMAIVAAFAMLGTAQAAEWNFYGSARVTTFWTDSDQADSTNLTQALQGNARIGAKVKVSDELKARFEHGTKNGVANIRQLWGEWNFGAGKLLVGQTYTPVYTVYSHSVYEEDGSLEKRGSMSASRQSMLRLTFGDFQIAAVEPQDDDNASSEVTIPKIEASYTASLNNVTFKLAGAFQTYEEANQNDVDSYAIGIGAKAKLGAAYLAGTAFTGQNIAAMGFKHKVEASSVLSGTTIEDTDYVGFTLVAGYHFNDMLYVEAGYGYSESDNDTWSSDDDETQYYLQSKITLAKGVYIIPEIGVVDKGNDNTGAEEDEVTYFGAKWQINF